MNQAGVARDRYDRAWYAESAFFYAIASGSLSLVHHVVTWWIRQFLSDSVRKILSQSSKLR